MNPLMSKLIATEIYLQRWTIGGAIALGLLSMAIRVAGKVAASVSFIAWISTVITFGVMLPMLSIMRERKERSLLFVLSLPLSPGDYVRAKLFGVVLCFLPFWLVMSAGAVIVALASPHVADGTLPITILLCVLLLMNFCIVLSFSLHIRSEGPLIAVIVGTNMSVSLFFVLVGAIPALVSHRNDATPVWNTEFWALLAALLTVSALALTAPLVFAGRRRNFI